MKEYLISPPFGNYIRHPSATPILGSFTIERRPGILIRALKTIRPVTGGWTNDMGLRNPGIKSVVFRRGHIYSIAALHIQDWSLLYDFIPLWVNLELNVGCPNIEVCSIPEEIIKHFSDRPALIIFKVSPIRSVLMIETLVNNGANFLHIANAMPLRTGGALSGKALKLVSLEIVQETKHNHPDIKIIAGGGIYNYADVQDYRAAGADYFSLATVWFKPWRALRILYERRSA